MSGFTSVRSSSLRNGLIAAACCVLLLASCGGGGSSSSGPTSQKQWLGWRFGYWDAAPGQAAQTAGQVNFTHVSDDCTCDTPAAVEWMEGRQIQLMEQARSAGTGPVMLSLSFLLFNRDSPHAYQWLGTDGVVQYKQRLAALDLMPMITALYPVDEPDLHGISDKAMAEDVTALRAVWGTAVHVAVIYSDHGTPGRSAFDWIGTDRYSEGSGVLGELPPLDQNQQWILVPGGADPWRTDPTAFIAFAESHPQVALVLPFLWQDYSGGRGIVSNGMASAYCIAGSLVTHASC